MLLAKQEDETMLDQPSGFCLVQFCICGEKPGMLLVVIWVSFPQYIEISAVPVRYSCHPSYRLQVANKHRNYFGVPAPVSGVSELKLYAMT